MIAKPAGSPQAAAHLTNPIGPGRTAASSDLLARCGETARALRHPALEGPHGRMFGLIVTSALDANIRAIDPMTGVERSYVCFDSNSYLGLHRHPEVLAAVRRSLDRFGFGTPSAQLMCGTSIVLRRLEETVAAFHGREDCMVFPSGFAACAGVIAALVQDDDEVIMDRFSHASLHDGARASGARVLRYGHRDVASLGRLLSNEAGRSHGRLIVTDGVFSMHGTLAALPELRRAANVHGATLLVDEAHSTGVIGSRGRGLEDAFSLPGAIDVLIGTFSKAPGAQGGYVCGSRDLITCLRFKARSGVFTAALPAPTCAGLTRAFELMEQDAEPRERLWYNVSVMSRQLRERGVPTCAPVTSPIITIPVGPTDRLLHVAWALLARGVKCGIVDFPAVPLGEGILRLAVNANHGETDIDRATAAIAAVLEAHPLNGAAVAASVENARLAGV